MILEYLIQNRLRVKLTRLMCVRSSGLSSHKWLNTAVGKTPSGWSWATGSYGGSLRLHTMMEGRSSRWKSIHPINMLQSPKLWTMNENPTFKSTWSKSSSAGGTISPTGPSGGCENWNAKLQHEYHVKIPPFNPYSFDNPGVDLII